MTPGKRPFAGRYSDEEWEVLSQRFDAIQRWNCSRCGHEFGEDGLAEPVRLVVHELTPGSIEGAAIGLLCMPCDFALRESDQKKHEFLESLVHQQRQGMSNAFQGSA
jgi:hypothetical protein